jgi:hypothetical protein
VGKTFENVGKTIGVGGGGNSGEGKLLLYLFAQTNKKNVKYLKNNPFLFCQTKTLYYICTNELLIIKNEIMGELQNYIQQEFENLISKKLDLNLFWSISIDRKSVRIMGDYSKNTIKHLLKKSFVQKDYIYADDESRLEFENGSIRVVLVKDL